MTLYRPHRGSLGASLRDAIEVYNIDELLAAIRATCACWMPEWALPTKETITNEPYAPDTRIEGWQDTWIVRSKNMPWGFTNGPLV